MSELDDRDLRNALDFVAELGQARDLDDFGGRIADGFDRIIPCRGASYNEINLHRRRVRWITGIPTGPGHVAAFEHHMPRNPIINYMAAHPESAAVAISDLVSERQWRSLGVYSDLYHPLGLEQILAVTAAAMPVMIGIALFRDGADFDARDRALLTLLRPHLVNAYRNAASLSDLGQRLAAIERGLDDAGLGVVLLTPSGGVEAMTTKARALFARYFGAPLGDDRLPGPVADWLAAVAAQPLAEAPPAPLRFARGDARLSLRLVRDGARCLILLEEKRGRPRAEELTPLGLTRREAEVAAWLPLGKSDAEIGTILAISPRTVSHTLERVYRKLGVDNRAAAAAIIVAAARFQSHRD